MKILFLCTANSCRSILSEAVFNHLAPAGLRAFSAGSFPKGVVHSLTLECLREAGIATAGLHSKSVDAHAGLAPDLVITVCDKAAGESCPVYFGAALRAHWGLADPSECRDGDAAMRAAFAGTRERIARRVQAFLAAQPESLSGAALQQLLNHIGTL